MMLILRKQQVDKLHAAEVVVEVDNVGPCQNNFGYSRETIESRLRLYDQPTRIAIDTSSQPKERAADHVSLRWQDLNDAKTDRPDLSGKENVHSILWGTGPK